uniref:Putative cytochrome p450 cyp3/cyp5/cyp6/cyp9 subfamily n=1 Tax=Ixodes ricinus TaxID=34613 RepID=A0A0K8R3T7_IXORI
MELLGYYILPNWMIVVLSAFTLLYMYLSRNKNYWKDQNIVHQKLSLSFVPLLKFLSKSRHEIDLEMTQTYGKLFGAFEGPQPSLIVAEPDIVKLVLVKDFPLLPDRRRFDLNDPILDNMMSQAPAQQWRRIRPAASPAFATGRLRKMNELIQECAKVSCEHLQEAARNEEELDAKQYFGHYTLDVIAKCAFGTKLDSHSNQTNEFVTRASQAFQMSVNLPLLLMFYIFGIFPFLMKLMKIKLFSSERFSYFKDVCANMMKSRRESGVMHHDFLQLMMDAQTTSLSDGSDPGDAENDVYSLGVDEKSNVATQRKTLTEMEAMAQCVIFLLAGQDTTSSVIAYTVYLLALHPDVQEKLRREVDECFEQYGPEPTLDVVSKLDYLNCVISESLRLYPPAVRLERSPVEDYVMTDTGIKLPKNCVIIIPIYAMHYDPSNFEDPYKFDPERFSEENRGCIRPYSYLPFGAGPRNCVGMRFALQTIKLCLLHAIHSVQFVRTPRTKVPLEFSRNFGLLTAKEIIVGVKPR